MPGITTLWTRLGQFRTAFQLKPHDTSTESGRSIERYRRVVMTAVANVVSRGISVLTQLISVPLALSYLGQEQFGVWMVLSSLAAMLAMTDFGLSAGLVNAISTSSGRNDQALIRRYISSAFALLCGIASLLTLTALLLYPHIPWAHLFRVHSASARVECGPAALAFIVCFAVSMPLAIPRCVHTGLQEGVPNAIAGTVGNVLGLGFLILALKYQASLRWLLLAQPAGTFIANLVNMIVLFTRRAWLRPSWRGVSFRDSGQLFRHGALFLLLSSTAAIGYQSDTMIINWLYGPDAVTRFAVPAKLFWVLITVSAMLLSPLWPAYGEAFARGDYAWVMKTLRRSVVMILAIFLGPTLLAVAFAPAAIRLWTHDAATVPDLTLLIGFGIWTISCLVTGPFAWFLVAPNLPRFSIITHLSMMVINVVFSILLARCFGIVGVLYGTVISQVAAIIIPCFVYLPKAMRAMQVKPRTTSVPHEESQSHPRNHPSPST